jgi:hypothetical protein
VVNPCCEDSSKYIVPLILLFQFGLLNVGVEAKPETANVITAATTLPGSRHKISRAELQFASRDLQDYFDNSEQMISVDPTTETYAEGKDIVPLREWTASLQSQLICIVGAQIISIPSPTSLISAYYANNAREAKLPVISHFCSLPRDRPPDGSTREAHALISLGYSLIRQLLEVIPPVIDCDSGCEPGPDQLRLLDGTLKSWNEVVSLLDRLLSFAPSILFCIIDGIEWLDDRSTDKHIKALANVLQNHVSKSRPTSRVGAKMPPERLFKVLFTTAGRSKALLDSLLDQQLVFADSLRAGRTPGKSMPGRQSLSSTTLPDAKLTGTEPVHE